jgi:hypothetical protein
MDDTRAEPGRAERPTIHWSELPADPKDDEHARDWNFYRREVGRLLAEGHEGRWVLIKGERIIGIWDTHEEAETAAGGRDSLHQVLIHQIRERELLLCVPPPQARSPDETARLARAERPTIHWSELPGDPKDDEHARDWNFYRREVGRLLAEGHEGRWVLIKGERIIGMWDTREEAFAVADERYLMQHYLVHRIRTWEPLLRTSTFMWRPRWRS